MFAVSNSVLSSEAVALSELTRRIVTTAVIRLGLDFGDLHVRGLTFVWVVI